MLSRMPRSSLQSETLLDAARACIVDQGLGRASLRLIAQLADVSVGSLSYRLGDRAQLIEALRLREAEALAARNNEWVARIRALGRLDDRQLVHVVIAWLDDQAANHRPSAIACCELTLDAARGQSHAAGLIDTGEAFWREVLADRDDAADLGLLLARYCLDEVPFSLLLSHDTDYRLLRAATIEALIGGPIVGAAICDWHDGLVGRLGERVSAITDGTGLLAKPQKLMLAERIAELIEQEGLSVLTHRRVAQASGIAASSVAHHFPQQRDLVLGGIEALYARMRRSMGSASGETSASGAAVILLTHEMALAALRDPDLRPFAIDMRRRRGENVRQELSRTVLAGHILDGASVQALVMAMIGGTIGLRAAGRDDRVSGSAALAAYQSVLRERTTRAA
jgi:AcrR family transcriptional regulator